MIYEVTSRQEWSAILDSMDDYDVYHTYDYHHLSLSPFEEAILMVYIENEIMVAIPIIVRPISRTKLFEATSVYGYPGPVSTGISVKFDSSKMAKSIFDFFTHKKIVCAFSRLNPYIPNQALILKNLGSLNIAGPLVGIDLTLNVTQQRERFSRRLKTQLNKAERSIHIREGEGMDDIILFSEIYKESMDRLDAEDRYYFSLEYFTHLLESDQINAKLLLAECRITGEVMAGSIFTISEKIVQYHLSGTLTKFMDAMPSKLLIDHMRKQCANTNLLHFNLGGGLGSSTDGLFRFKKSFSPSLRSYSLWRYVVNQKAYNKLVKKRPVENFASNYKFPEYRN